MKRLFVIFVIFLIAACSNTNNTGLDEPSPVQEIEEPSLITGNTVKEIQEEQPITDDVYQVAIIGNNLPALAAAYYLNDKNTALFYSEPQSSTPYKGYTYDDIAFFEEPKGLFKELLDDLNLKPLEVKDQAVYFRERYTLGSAFTDYETFSVPKIMQSEFSNIYTLFNFEGQLLLPLDESTSLTRKLDLSSIEKNLEDFNINTRSLIENEFRRRSGSSLSETSMLLGTQLITSLHDNPVYTFEKGMDTLKDALRSKINSRIYDVDIDTIDQNDAYVVIRYHHGNSTKVVRARKLIITLDPEEITQKMIKLTDAKFYALQKIDYGEVLNAVIVTEKPLFDKAFHVSVSDMPFSEIFDVAHHSSKENRPGILLVQFTPKYVGNNDYLDWDDDRIRRELQSGLKEVLGLKLTSFDLRTSVAKTPYPNYPKYTLERIDLLREPIGKVHFAGNYIEGLTIESQLYSARLAASS